MNWITPVCEAINLTMPTGTAVKEYVNTILRFYLIFFTDTLWLIMCRVRHHSNKADVITVFLENFNR